MRPYLFYSASPEYRFPSGAVTPRTAVLFRVCVPREWGCRACRLLVNRDDQPLVYAEMFWAGMADHTHEWWDCHFEPTDVGLYFYTFELQCQRGVKTLRRQQDGTAGISDSGRNAPWWQLTCYAADFETPDWLAGGVMYQIFPDRFARSAQHKEGVPADRRMHKAWDEPVCWKPDTQGEYHCDDYYGGDLKGIEERLDHLKSLGVTCLYLNPIFEAHSNHRYNTACYRRVDPLLGTEEDLRSLIRTAATLGIRVMLDGVFSHTGSDSEYFNREGRYDTVGAFQSPTSAFYNWFNFRQWPASYESWWGFETLPEVNETHPTFMDYINGEDGVVRHWQKLGLGGWRLDVADELPDGFLDALRTAVKAEDPDAIVLGEVWEDASNKFSYGHRRRYLLGKQLDSVMNYPFADAIIGFLRGGNSRWFGGVISTIVEHYPPQVVRILMNHIGTHDTERAITMLAGEPAQNRGRPWQAEQVLSPEQRAKGIRLMKLASALQYCLPGVPCIYYGDEAGVEGYRDPFNRSTYPWGRENAELLLWYRRLGKMRKVALALKEGEFIPYRTDPAVACFERVDGDKRLLCAVNRTEYPKAVPIGAAWAGFTAAIGGGIVDKDGNLLLPALDCVILIDNNEEI